MTRLIRRECVVHDRGRRNTGVRIGQRVGDQISDMSLGALEHGFLIPNPMYLIP